MRDRSERYQGQGVSALASPKRIGGYLVDAGLLTPDQINVALNDQQATGMRFGEIIVARGWLKEQTVEWVMTKVVEPERRRRVSPPPAVRSEPRSSLEQPSVSKPAASVPPAKPAADPSPHRPFVRREVPISKPLPSVGSSDGDVNWVG